MNNNFNVSDVVIHKVFGEGVILNIAKENEEEEILIKFEDSDKPKIILPAFGSISKKNEDSENENFDFFSGIDSGKSNDDDFSEYFDD